MSYTTAPQSQNQNQTNQTMKFFSPRDAVEQMEQEILRKPVRWATNAQYLAWKKGQHSVRFGDVVEPFHATKQISMNLLETTTTEWSSADLQSASTLGSWEPFRARGWSGTWKAASGFFKFNTNSSARSLIGKYSEMSPTQDLIMNAVESQLIFMYNMYRARTCVDRLVAYATLAKFLNTGISEGGVALTLLCAAFEYFLPKEEFEQDLEVQAFTFPKMTDMRSFLDSYDQIKTSKLYEKLYKFSMYAMSLNLLKPIGVDMDYMKYDVVAQAAIKNKYHLGHDFVYTLLDTLLFVCERGYQCLEVGSLLPLYLSEDKCTLWYDEADKLIRQAQCLSNPKAHGLDRFKYMSDVKDSIAKGRSIRLYSKRPEEKVMISRLLSRLELTHDLEMTKRAASAPRPAPFTLLLYGGSSIGKSTMSDILFVQYGRVRGLSTESHFKYTRNPTEEFWSNFDSTKWCIQLDDIAFLAPQLGVMDPTLAEMLCIANNVPYVPAQAELADKGRTPVQAELVFATTNTKELNLSSYFSCPLAVQRRFPFVVDMKPKREYIDPSRPGMLDSTRVPKTPEGEYPDLWTFVIERVVPATENRNRQMGKLEKYLECANMKEFLAWYNKAIIDHMTTQDKVLASGTTISNVTTCSTCHMPNTWCSCDLQAGVTDENSIVLYERPTYLDYVPTDLPEPASTHPFVKYVDTCPIITRLVVWYYLLTFYCLTYFGWVEMLVEWWYGTGWFYWWIAKSHYKYELTKCAIGYIGQEAHARFNAPKCLKTIAVAAAACLVTYKTTKGLWNMFTALPVQGGEQSVPRTDRPAIGKTPEPDGIERATRSYVDEFAVSAADFSQHTLCAKNRDPELLLKHIEKATVVFYTEKDKVNRVTSAVNVRGSVYMCNAHGIPPEGDFYLNIVSSESQHMSSNMKNILVTPSMVKRYVDKDLAFLNLRCRPPATNLVNYFCGQDYTGMVNGTYIGRDVTGKSWRAEVINITPGKASWKSHNNTVTADVWNGKVQDYTAVGDCGMLLFSQTPAGPIILGIHTLGRDGRVAAMKVTYEQVSKGCLFFDGGDFVNRGRVEISAPSKTRNLGDLSVQSVIHKSHAGVADVLGSFTGEFRQRGRTNVGPTFIQDQVMARGYTLDKTKPAMNSTPWVHALNDMTRPVTLMRDDMLSTAKWMFIDETAPRITKTQSARIHVYPIEVAINGCAGVLYCDKMNRKSSAGAPYKKSKKHFIYFVDESESTDVNVVQEIEDSIYNMIDIYKRGERVHTVYCGHLKDEPVTFEKALDGKTRVFTASGMAYTVVVRMYLLSVIVHMQNNRFTYETGPGTVAQSLEWEEIREHLTAFGEDRIVAGDYSKFDKRMPANVILAAFDIILQMCETAGYSDADLRVVRGIAYDTAFPTVDFNGDLVEFYGSNPSGHPLTVIVNGLANSLYMRYCFVVLRPLGSEQFTDFVKLMTYGDDNIMGVSEGAPWFNHTAIQKVLADVDVGYTMADKLAESVPYIHINDANFLKRTWRWDEGVGAYVAPLDETSIAKMLTICVHKKNISPQAHAMQVVETAVREYFWYGRETFERKVVMFREILDEAQLTDYIVDSTFPTWQSLKDDFWTNSKHVVLKRDTMVSVPEQPLGVEM